jgi:hypothetical protein
MTAITSPELKAYRAANQSDLSTNGGRMSAYPISSGVVGALFPNVDDTERTAGSIKYRKAFFKVDHPGPEALLSTRMYQDKNSAGDDKVCFFLGTQTDTQSAITGSERKYGCGDLDASTLAGATTVTVEVEVGQTGLFAIADLIRVTDKATLGGAGNEEFVTVVTASQTGDIVTLTVTPPLGNAYSNASTRVASVYDASNVVANYVSFSKSSTLGVYDDTTYPIVLNDKSSIEQTWTGTFTTSTAFDISGNTVGAVGSGTVGGGAAPNNADFSYPFFTMAAAGFSGTWAPGDTFTFTTHPAAVPIWIKRQVPAGAGTTAASTAVVVMDGGSA